MFIERYFRRESTRGIRDKQANLLERNEDHRIMIKTAGYPECPRRNGEPRELQVVAT